MDAGGNRLCPAPGLSLSFLGGDLSLISTPHNLIHVNKSVAPITAGLPEPRLSQILSDFLGALCLQVAKIYPVESQAWQHTLERGLAKSQTSTVSLNVMQLLAVAPWSCLIMPYRLQKTRNFPTLSGTVEVSLPSGITTQWSSFACTPRSFAVNICSARFALFDALLRASNLSSRNSKAS